MKNKKKHLSIQERFFIEKMLRAGSSISNIAKLLGRGKSTISSEINKNGGNRHYDHQRSENASHLKQNKKKIYYNKIIQSRSLRRFVDKLISEGISPERISKIIKMKRKLVYVSPKSIRKYMKSKIVM